MMQPTIRMILPVLLLLSGFALPVHAGWEEGRALFAEGQYAEAARQFQEVTEAHPDWASGHFMLGQSLNKLNRHSEALVALRKTHELEPQQAQFSYALGKLYAQVGRDGEANTVLATVDAKALPPAAQGDFYQTWAVARTRSGQKDEALELWASAAAARPQDREIQYQYGVALFNAKRYTEAVPSLEKAVSGMDQPPAEHLRALVRALKDSGAYRRATEVAQGLVTREADPGNYLLLGESQLGVQDYQAAIASFQKADPTHWLPHFYSGQAHFFLDDLKAAETSFDAALKRNSEAADQQRIWLEQARVYSGQERYNEAALAYARGGDREGVARARENQKIKLHNIRAEAEQAEYQAILDREKEIQTQIDNLLNGHR